MSEDKFEINNNNENNNENNEENNDKPFVNLDNIDNFPDLKNEEKNELIKERNINNLKPSEITEEDMSISSNTESVGNLKKEKAELNINSKQLYEESKKKLEPYQLKMLYTIKNIEDMVKIGERQRNYKIRSEFEREKEYKLEEQDEIKNKIIELSKNNINEKLINHFNIRIEKQEELYNQFDEMKSDVLNKIELIKSEIPSLEKSVKEKNEKLKNLNKNNLKLLDKINELENDNNNNNNSKNNNISTNMNNSQYGNNSSVILNNSSQLIGNQSTNFLNNSDKFPKGIKINEIVRDNEDIKNQYNRILELKKEYKYAKNKNQKMIKSINEMSMDCFLFKKIFNEGMNEIGRELLKIHELKLDKVINGTNQNKNSSSLYFQIVKTKTNGNETKNDDILKLPLINKNIIEKYNYPIVEKSEPKTLIYNAIKHVLDDNLKEVKKSNMKKNKIDWDEFKNFSSYQIYTILNMNKNIIKKLEGKIFPRKLIFPNSTFQEEESINLKDDNIDTNDLIEDDDF